MRPKPTPPAQTRPPVTPRLASTLSGSWEPASVKAGIPKWWATPSERRKGVNLRNAARRIRELGCRLGPSTLRPDETRCREPLPRKCPGHAQFTLRRGDSDDDLLTRMMRPETCAGTVARSRDRPRGAGAGSAPARQRTSGRPKQRAVATQRTGRASRPPSRPHPTCSVVMQPTCSSGMRALALRCRAR